MVLKTRSLAAGFTLVEVLVATGVMAIVMVGVLGLFMHGVDNNQQGRELTAVTNHARSHLETLMALPFNAPELTVPNGADALEVRELYSETAQSWIDEATFPVAEVPLFGRVTRVRQFNTNALSPTDLELTADEVVPGGTPARFVQLKEIEVRVNSGAITVQSALGKGAKAINLRTLRAS